MKPVYRLFKRGNYFYTEDTRTGRQESLKTQDRFEAERLLMAKNEATNTAELTLAVGRAYLAAIDPGMLTRTWSDVMSLMMKRGKLSTQARCDRAFRSPSFNSLRDKIIMETTSSDFLMVLSDDKQATNHYLKLLHGSALDLGWLIRPVLTRKCWPKVAAKEKRAITWDEHCRIIAVEKNDERRLYYDLLWETGASQTDAALLSSENVDWSSGTLIYVRGKTRQQATIRIGKRLEEILRKLPIEGAFFPNIRSLTSTARAAEFYRRCTVAKIAGVSLHSYRYAWAERAFRLGYPERFAQAALGHGSRAVHYSYARKAKVLCPSLDQFRSG